MIYIGSKNELEQWTVEKKKGRKKKKKEDLAFAGSLLVGDDAPSELESD